MGPALYHNFAEASQKLLEILDAILPEKTLFLAKRSEGNIRIEKVLANSTGITAKEGDLFPIHGIY